MTDDILSEYGKDSGAGQVARATNGGQVECKDLPYSPPKGPMGQMQKGVGLGGTNHGCAGTQGKH
jgi:hypothetical protein